MSVPLVLSTPISTRLFQQILPEGWPKDPTLQLIWLGGLRICYKAAWPHKQSPRLKLHLWTRQFGYFLSLLDADPQLTHVSSTAEILEQVSNFQAQDAHIFFHVENESGRSWLLLEEVGSQLQFFDWHTHTRISASQLVGQHKTLHIVAVLKTLVNKQTPATITQRALRQQATLFTSSAEPMQSIGAWLTALRRPSLRLSWQNLLANPRDYFWVMVQLGTQLRGFSSTDGFDGYRLSYANGLVAAAGVLERPELRQLALDVRRSAEAWQLIQDILLMGKNPVLNETRMLLLSGTSIYNPNFSKLADRFVRTGGMDDIDFRLRAIENKIHAIKDIERSVFYRLFELVEDTDALQGSASAAS